MRRFDEGWDEGAKSTRVAAASISYTTRKSADKLLLGFSENRLKLATEKNLRLEDELKLARARDRDREWDEEDAAREALR